MESIQKEIDELVKLGIRVRFLGDRNPFPDELKKVLGAAEEKTCSNDRLNLNVMLGYGSRHELVHAFQKIQQSGMSAAKITPEVISEHLYTAGMPDPDLLIRTSGEYRLSNFMLWQLAYAEIYITDVLWPAFSEKELYEALANFSQRERRWGHV